MGKRTGLARWLRVGGTERVVDVLRHRPDAVVPPPAGLGELAERLSSRPSALRALDQLDRACLQLLQTLLLLGDGADRAGVAELHGASPELDRALGRLVELALVWPDGTERLRVAGALRTLLPEPHGLGEPIRALLAAQTVPHLRELAERTGCAAPTRKDDILAALHRHLTDPERVRAVAAQAPPGAAELLEHLVRTAPRLTDLYRLHPQDTVYGPPEVRWLMERGLLFPSSWSTADLPREVALVLRGPGPLLPLDPPPPAPHGAAVDPAAVDAAAGAAALATMDAVALLVESCEAAPVTQLRSGGVGVRELRRLAKQLGATERDVRLWIELAAGAGLLAVTAGEVVPTTGFDDWHAADPATRLAALLVAWWVSWDVPSSPLRDVDGSRPAALARGYRELGPVLRRDLLTALRRDRSTDVDQLWPLLAWSRPTVLGSAEVREDAGPATFAEAEALGVLALGARSALAAALLEGAEEDRLAALAAPLLPSPVGTVRLLPDLTAVVAGTPSPALATLLDRVAGRESRDTASTWRFTPATVRAAFDGGDTVDGLLTALAAVSDGALPQPLHYLIRDTGRRHGRLQVAAVSCCVVSDDAALLTEVVHHRGLQECRPRLLAPTVLASSKPVARTLELLRGAGFAPVLLDGSGAVRVERRERRRAKAAPPVHRTATVPPAPDPARLATLAERLLSRDDAHTERSSLTVHQVRRYSTELPPVEVVMLAEAVDRGRPVTIDYVDSGGNATRRTVEPLEFDPPLLVAWCRMRDDERHFLLDRIVAVSPA